MTDHDVLYGYRLALFDLAARTSVSRVRIFGVHRSTYYRWKRRSTGTAWRCCGPGSGDGRGCRISSRRWSSSGSSPTASVIPARAGSDRRRAGPRRWGGILVSAQRRVASAQTPRPQHARQATGPDRRLRRALPATPRAAPRAAHPGHTTGRAGRHRLLLRRSTAGTKTRSGRSPRSTATPPTPGPTSSPAPPANPPTHTSRSLAASPPTSPAAAGSSNACSPTTATSFEPASTTTLTRLNVAPHPHPTRPTPDQRPRRKPAQDHPRRMLAPQLRPLPPHPPTAAYEPTSPNTSTLYNTDRAHNGRITKGRIPADIIDPAHKMRPPHDHHPSPQLGESPRLVALALQVEEGQIGHRRPDPASLPLHRPLHAQTRAAPANRP